MFEQPEAKSAKFRLLPSGDDAVSCGADKLCGAEKFPYSLRQQYCRDPEFQPSVPALRSHVRTSVRLTRQLRDE